MGAAGPGGGASSGQQTAAAAFGIDPQTVADLSFDDPNQGSNPGQGGPGAGAASSATTGPGATTPVAPVTAPATPETPAAVEQAPRPAPILRRSSRNRSRGTLLTPGFANTTRKTLLGT